MQGFPQYVLPLGDSLSRIHRTEHGPWFFRNDGEYRFDLTNRPGWGTCYFAEDELGAFVEALQGVRAGVLSRLELSARRIFTYRVQHALVLADVTKSVAGRYGVTASIGASTAGDYAASQRLADRAFGAGFAGVRYLVRNDPEQNLHGVALFGPAGPQPDDLLAGNDAELDENLIARACRDASFRCRGPLLDPR